jgi:ribosome-binding protein aMBF1 (putative translation factor)
MCCALVYAKQGFKSFWSMCRATQRSKTMTTLLKKKLQGTDWQIGEVADFLQLSAEESALIDIRLWLAQAAKQSRVQHELSQTELAKRMKSSQSRIAKIEAADPSVSIDLMVRALLASGAGRADVAKALR